MALTRPSVRALQLPSSLRIEPMKFGTGTVLEMAAGDVIPDTDVVVLSAAGQRLAKALIAGQKQHLRVAQQLYYLGPSRQQGAGGAGAAAAAGGADGEAPVTGTMAAAESLATLGEAQGTVQPSGKGSDHSSSLPACRMCPGSAGCWQCQVPVGACGATDTCNRGLRLLLLLLLDCVQPMRMSKAGP
jgi:hypothetical protein